MQICPSMPLPTMDALVANINKLSPFYNYFQIDICDGIYVNNRTLQIEDIANNYKQFNKYQSLIFDFHLMVKDYKTDIDKINLLKKFLNIKNVFIHSDLHPNYSLVTSHYPLFNIGLTLNPKDQVVDLASQYDLEVIPCLQIMSVTPGVQGNPFIPETLLKIEQLRGIGYKSKIFLDGAVNDKTLRVINKFKYKPDVICPGSFLTKAKDLEKNVNYLKQLT